MIDRETDRLRIRNFKNEDWIDLLEIAKKYEASEFAKYDHKWPQTAEEIKQAVESSSSGDSFVAVELKADSKVIGLVSIPKDEQITDEKVYDFGYVSNLDYQGKGYAFDSCMNVLEYLFNEKKIDRIVTSTAVVNRKSCELLDRLGFKETSRQTEHLRKDANDKPIEFLAAEYELSAEGWRRKEKLDTAKNACTSRKIG